MWVVGDWGQEDPWTQASGVRMTKGEDGLYTGVLTLPKGTRFDLKILKNPAAGTLIWSATRYASVLNSDGSYDFGEFTDNLVPNGGFEGVKAQWTPANSIVARDNAHGGGHILAVSSRPVYSDTFVIPPNQNLRCSYYVRSSVGGKYVSIEVKDVDTQAVLFEKHQNPKLSFDSIPASGEFKTGGSPVRACVVCTSYDGTTFGFDDIAIVSP